MSSKKLVAWLILSALLMGWMPIARAEEKFGEEGFVEVKAGETVPEDGLFFDYPALSKVMAKQETKLSLLVLEKETAVKKLNLDIENISKKKDAEIQINKETYEQLLKNKQERIDALILENKWNSLYFVGGALIGVVTSIVIFYAAVQVAK